MKLVVGLGNPGKQYECTRHNAGFMAIDNFAKKNNVSFSLDTKLQGMIGTINLNGNKAILLKPMTYMNLSGESVSRVMNYFKIDKDDVLIICDDLDSRLGRVRLRAKGSAGGHNGLKSISNLIKTEEYKRIKIGIDRSPVIPVVDWVLKKYTNDELATLAPTFDICSDAIYDFITGVDFVKISSKYSSK